MVAIQPVPDAEAADSADTNVWLKKMFKERSAAAHAADFALSTTLGQGTYGRVRLAESPAVKQGVKESIARALKEGEHYEHSGYFAIKILKKSEIIRLKQGDHVKAERDLLLKSINHPFVVTAHGSYKDERNLYLILDYVPGGEVLAKCRASCDALNNDTSKFYAAQLVMALQYLHADQIIYRGLVPDNLLIDKTGYLKLVDFGFAKRLPIPETGEALTYTLCGTAEYLAPEIVNSKGHSKGADWWALGVVIYEMLAGYPPFYAQNPFEIYQHILKATPTYPAHFDLNLYEGMNRETGTPMVGPAPQPGAPPANAPRAGLICRLLHPNRLHRIGCLKNGAEDIKKHKWFRGLNWAALYNKHMAPPEGVPQLIDDADTSNFPSYPDSVEESGPLLEPAKQALYDYW